MAQKTETVAKGDVAVMSVTAISAATRNTLATAIGGDNALPPGFSIARPVGTPTLSVEVGPQNAVCVQLLSEMRTSTYVEKPKKTGRQSDDKKKDPARIADVLNLKTRQANTLICNAVIESTLREMFPKVSPEGEVYREAADPEEKGPGELTRAEIDAAPGQWTYLGKCFYIEKLPKKPGRDYFPFQIYELQHDTAPVADPAAQS